MKKKAKFLWWLFVPAIGIAAYLVIASLPKPLMAHDEQLYRMEYEMEYATTGIAMPAKVYVGSSTDVGKVTVINGGYYPGSVITFELPVYNGGDDWAVCRLNYKKPNIMREPYYPAPDSYQKFVTINHEHNVLAVPPKGISTVSLTLAMSDNITISDNASIYPPLWEFQLNVKDLLQAGDVQTAVSTRFLVKMR